MKPFTLRIALLSLCLSGLVHAAEPTLEELDALGESAEASAKAKAKEGVSIPAKGKASTQAVESAVPGDGNGIIRVQTIDSQKVPDEPKEVELSGEQPSLEQAEFMRPASDMSGAQSIDIQNTMKKITEPNLFMGAASNPGTLRNLASGEAPEEYSVNIGDTLYDICDQLIDEADYWPKLWAFNPTIENPHFVYPGMRLRFYAGDDKSPPFLQVVTEDDILPVAKGKISEAELVREDISGMLMRSEIPQGTTILDPSDIDALLRVDHLFVEVGGNYKAKSKDVVIPAFVVSDKIAELGLVVGGSAGSFLVDKGQQIIIKKKDGLAAGTTYSVVRKGDDLRNSKGKVVGVRYEFVAQIQVMTQDQKDDEIFKGVVVFNRLGVEPGDIVIAYRSVKRVVPNELVVDGEGSEQEVVDFSEPHTNLGGRGGFVFLDQSTGKLQEKRTYQILQNVKVAASRFMKDSLPDTDSRVAQVYVLDANGSAALGYLVQDSLEVRIGDRVAP